MQLCLHGGRGAGGGTAHGARPRRVSGHGPGAGTDGGDRWRRAGGAGPGQPVRAEVAPQGRPRCRRGRGGTGRAPRGRRVRTEPSRRLSRSLSRGMVSVRRHGNPRPAGGGEQVAGRRRQGRSPIPAGLSTRPSRRRCEGSPPHPGRDPERVSRGSPRTPGTREEAGGAGCGAMRAKPLGGRRARRSRPAGPGAQGAKAAGPRKGAGAAPRGPHGRGIRGVPFPGRTMAVRKAGRLSSPPQASPRDAFPCPTPALPSPPPVGPHHCGAARGKPSPATREWGSVSLQGQPGLSPLPDPAEPAGARPGFLLCPSSSCSADAGVVWYPAWQ